MKTLFQTETFWNQDIPKSRKRKRRISIARSTSKIAKNSINTSYRFMTECVKKLKPKKGKKKEKEIVSNTTPFFQNLFDF